MFIEFETLQDALNAGYQKVNRKTDKDTSGGTSFGYDFENQQGQRTVTVWFTKEGRSQYGCFRPMYPPVNN